MRLSKNDLLEIIINKLGVENPEDYFEKMTIQKRANCDHEYIYYGNDDTRQRVDICEKCGKHKENICKTKYNI